VCCGVEKSASLPKPRQSPLRRSHCLLLFLLSSPKSLP
jgi:hypothetical protein